MIGGRASIWAILHDTGIRYETLGHGWRRQNKIDPGIAILLGVVMGPAVSPRISARHRRSELGFVDCKETADGGCALVVVEIPHDEVVRLALGNIGFPNVIPNRTGLLLSP